MMVFFN